MQTKLSIAWSWVGRTVSVQCLKWRGSLCQTKLDSGRASSHIHAWSHSANKAATKKTRNAGQFEQTVKFTHQRVLWRQIVANLNESSFTSRPWKRVQSPRGRRTVGSQPMRSRTVGSEDQKASSWVLASCGSQREPSVQWSASGEPTVMESQTECEVNTKLWAHCEEKYMVGTHCAVLVLGDPVAGLAVQLVWKKLCIHCEVVYKLQLNVKWGRNCDPYLQWHANCELIVKWPLSYESFVVKCKLWTHCEILNREVVYINVVLRQEIGWSLEMFSRVTKGYI